MKITDEQLAAWMAPLVGKQGASWPTQRTFHAILRGGLAGLLLAAGLIARRRRPR